MPSTIIQGMRHPLGDGFITPERGDADGYYDAQGFGENRHNGVDLNGDGGGNTDLGDPVYAVANGIVTQSGFLSSLGEYLVIRSDFAEPIMINGALRSSVVNVFAHLDTGSRVLAVGDTVSIGQKIGEIGNTGDTTYAHLHWETRLGEEYRDADGYGSASSDGWVDPIEFVNQYRDHGISPPEPEPVGPTSGADFLAGTDGNDSIDALGGNDEVYGNGGRDTLDGGSGNDTIAGQDGNDDIFGGIGDDRLYGGEGLDDIEGGADDDLMRGENGDDSIKGDAGDDTAYGDAGEDTLRGGDGHDLLLGGEGRDKLYGNDGADDLRGEGQDDRLYGNDGNDTLYGGQGDDDLSGGSNDDDLRGEEGNDTLDGDSGDDDLSGGADNDTIIGGTGVDTVYYSGSWSDYTVSLTLDGGLEVRDMRFGSPEGVDYLDPSNEWLVNWETGEIHSIADLIADLTPEPEPEPEPEPTPLFTSGADLVELTSSGPHRALGGNDTVVGTHQADIVHGQAGFDILTGRMGDDRLYGWSGADTIHGGMGDDILGGGSGRDLLIDGMGKDVLIGGDHADVFVFVQDGNWDIVSDFTDGQDLIGFTGGVSFNDIEVIDVAAGVRINHINDVILLLDKNGDLSAVDITADDILLA